MHLVLLETSGNQRYIFATNKLRENVGASEWTYRVGTRQTLEAVASVTGDATLYAEDFHTLHTHLLSDEKNPPLEQGKRAVEVILATSGKALLLVRDMATGEHIIRHVTEQTLRQAPGLTVHGAISALPELTLEDVHRGIGQVHEALEQVRYQVPGVAQRFLRRPFVAECATSGLPAAIYDARPPEAGARSAVTLAKRQEARAGRDRMAALVRSVAPEVSVLPALDDLEARFTELGWVAVVHADGNGLGQLLLNFAAWLRQVDPGAQGRAYLNAYRRFSLALDVCTVRAFGTALHNLHLRMEERPQQAPHQARSRHPRAVPVVPLVLGGDDLTVVCDGQYAVRFTHDFLTAFETETMQTDVEHLDGIIPEIAQKAFTASRLSSCAGIAIVKPHFPFHAAYELAEELLQSAKQVKQKVQVPCSALDYHVLYDASGADLRRIRGHLKVDNGATVLVGRPYVVTPREHLGKVQHDTWVIPRLWDHLQNRVQAMCRTDTEDTQRRLLPNSMLHSLREGLFLGRQQADARMHLVRQRYQAQGFDTLLGSTGSLFWPESPDTQSVHTTGFLDALDLVGFWQ